MLFIENKYLWICHKSSVDQQIYLKYHASMHSMVNELPIQTTITNRINSDLQCLLTCLGLEIDGEDTINMDVSCIGPLFINIK